MIKTYMVEYEVNMCAEHTITVRVKANTERKAKKIAEKHLEKQGYYNVNFLRIKDMEIKKLLTIQN